MEAIFLAGNSYPNDDIILGRLAEIFIEMASISNYYDYIQDYVKKIAEFTFYLVRKIVIKFINFKILNYLFIFALTYS
jgi:hypothetical protein